MHECIYENYLGVHDLCADDQPAAGPPGYRLAAILGYTLVGDNVDKGVKTRYMRQEQYGDQSLHYFHSMAVQNRIDFSIYPDVHLHTCLDQPKRRAKSLLPSQLDDTALRTNVGILVSRVLADHMPFFQFTFQDVIHMIVHCKLGQRLGNEARA